MGLLTLFSWGLTVVAICWFGGMGRVLGQSRPPGGYYSSWALLLAIALLGLAGRMG
jgi:hypothetical protein